MALFSKKEKIEPQLEYNNWEKDFGFLTLILTRKKNIIKEYLINVYANQKQSKTDYLTDDEIESFVDQISNEVISQVGDKYKNYLINKYYHLE